MAVLTWRNVDAPDFRPAMEGIGQASSLLTQAFSNASKTVEGIRSDQDKDANNAVLMNLLQYSDPQKYQDALNSGALTANIDSTKLNATTINALANRSTQLLQQQHDQLENSGLTETNSFTQYEHGRTKDENTNADAAAPVVSQLIAAGAQGDDKTIAKIWSNPDNATLLNKLPTKDLLANSQGIQGLVKGNLDIATGRQMNQQSAVTFKDSQQDRDEGRQAQALTMDLIQRGVKAEDIDAYIGTNMDALGKKYAAPVLMRARGMALTDPSIVPYGSAGVGGGASGAGGGGNASPDVLGITYGGAQLPDNVKTLGDAVDYGPTLVKSKGSSPIGMYQITYGTIKDFAPQVFGANWRNINLRDAGVQDKLGRAIFDSTKGDPSALMSRWASLNPTEAAAVAKMPWEQARQVIAKGESGANVSALLSQATGVQTQLSNNLSGNNDTDMARNFSKLAGDTTPTRGIAVQLTGKEGVLAGQDVSRVADKIASVQHKYGVSAAVAGSIISQAAEGKPGFFEVKSPIFGGDGIDTHFNEKEIDRLGHLAKDQHGLRENAEKVSDTTQAQGLIAQAQQRYLAANAAIKAKVQRANQLGRTPNISAEMLELQNAQDQLQAAMGNGASLAISGMRSPDTSVQGADAGPRIVTPSSSNNHQSTPKRVGPILQSMLLDQSLNKRELAQGVPMMIRKR